MADQSSSSPNQPTGATQPTPAWTPPIDAGSQVVLLVSRGASPSPTGAPVVVPDVLGVSQGDALAKLQEVGLAAQVFNDFSATVAKGKVVGQLPDSGMSAPRGISAVLMVSNGPAEPSSAPQVALPEVVGLSESAAVSKLQSAGLVSQVVRDYSPNVLEGAVMAQLPSARSLAVVPPKKGVPVWLWVALAVVALLLIGGIWYASQNQSQGGAFWFLGVSQTPTSTVEPTETVEATAPVEPTVDTAQVPDVVGMTQKEAESALEDAGFVALVTKVTTNDSPSGDVVAQVPSADTELTNGSQVAIQVAQAKEPEPPSKVKVPNVVGMTQANAQSALVKAGLAPSFVNQESSAPKGQAFEQQPAAGDSVEPNTVVLVAISSGKPPAPEPTTVAVPSLIGKKQADAENALSSAGLDSQVVQSYSPTADKGTVFQQWPPAGNKVAPGTPIALVVSMGVQPSGDTNATVPDVKGMDVDAATKALAEVDLVAQVVTIDDPTAAPGVVLGQLPAASSKVPEGSTVLIGVPGVVDTP